jgi:hypothetical protein
MADGELSHFITQGDEEEPIHGDVRGAISAIFRAKNWEDWAERKVHGALASPSGPVREVLEVVRGAGSSSHLRVVLLGLTQTLPGKYRHGGWSEDPTECTRCDTKQSETSLHILACPSNQNYWRGLTHSLVGILTCMSEGLDITAEQIRVDAEAICSALTTAENKLGGLVGLLPEEVGTLLSETGYGNNRLVRKAIIQQVLNTSAAIIKSWWTDRCRRSEQGQEVGGPIAIAGLLD